VLVALGGSGCYDFARFDPPLAYAGFESDEDMFMPSAVNGAFTLDGLHAWRGAQSLRLSVETSGAGPLWRAETLAKGLPSSPLSALRAFVYADELPPAPGTRLVTLQQTVAPYRSVSMLVATDGEILLTHQLLGESQSGTVRSGKHLPAGEWACLELQVEASRGRVLLGDQVLIDETIPSTTDDPPLDGAYFGPLYGQAPDRPYALWLDEAVVASHAIGCIF
jgi:hypothetical protein